MNCADGLKDAHDSPEPVRVAVRGGFTLVDPQDVALASEPGWKIRNGYVMRFFWDRKKRNTGYEALHRLIAGTPLGMVTDHIDRDTLNNTRSNLRVCTQAQNSANSTAHRRRDGATSRYKGVHRQPGTDKWIAMIGTGGKILYLGTFAVEEDAARAYDDAARKHFGEYARLNFARDGERSVFDGPAPAKPKQPRPKRLNALQRWVLEQESAA